MTEKEVLGLKPAPRLEIGDRRCKQAEEPGGLRGIRPHHCSAAKRSSHGRATFLYFALHILLHKMQRAADLF